MKIAVIDHILNPGGGARIIRSLLPAMKEIQPHLDITFFGTPHGIKREQLLEITEPNQIKVRLLHSTSLSGKDLFRIRGSRFVISLMQSKLKKFSSFLPVYLSGQVHKELESLLGGYDIAFFTWPFHIECPKLKCPMVGIFQDFNYKYYFSSNISTPWMSQSLNRHMHDLLVHFTPIVTSQFVAEEMRKFYPSYTKDIRVVPIAPMGEKMHSENIKAVLKKFNLTKKFLLYPTNTASHKNIGPLLAAIPYIRERGYDVILVLAGLGTERINGKACAQGVELDNKEQDVFGLGYVSNAEINALIQSASVVVNCSLYEGNNGPALDAWALGAPVAMSNIPPFIELLSTFKVHAAIFDPRSPLDIANKIIAILSDIKMTKQNVIFSQQSISQYTWEKCAEQYLHIFEDLCRSCLKKL